MEKIYYNTQVAAETLDQLVPGESVAYWREVLIDNRTHERAAPFAIAVVETGGGLLYELEELRRFAGLIQDIDEQLAARPARVA